MKIPLKIIPKMILCLIALSLLFSSQNVLASKITGKPEKTSFSPQQRQDVEQIIKEYLKDNPHVIINSIRAMQERQSIIQKELTKKNIEKYKKHIFNDPNSPVAGNLKGDITIVEFHDYRCGYCKRVFLDLKKLMKKDKNIRFIFKEFPILSKRSELAARAAIATWHQDKTKYIAIHAAFMNTRGDFKLDRILRIANKIGLDIVQLEKDMKAASTTKILEKNRKLAGHLGIKGTPAFVIADRLIPGAPDLTTLRKIISEVRKTKR